MHSVRFKLQLIVSDTALPQGYPHSLRTTYSSPPLASTNQVSGATSRICFWLSLSYFSLHCGVIPSQSHYPEINTTENLIKLLVWNSYRNTGARRLIDALCTHNVSRFFLFTLRLSTILITDIKWLPWQLLWSGDPYLECWEQTAWQETGRRPDAQSHRKERCCFLWCTTPTLRHWRYLKKSRNAVQRYWMITPVYLSWHFTSLSLTHTHPSTMAAIPTWKLPKADFPNSRFAKC